jgi:hypothetical protein
MGKIVWCEKDFDVLTTTSRPAMSARELYGFRIEMPYSFTGIMGGPALFGFLRAAMDMEDHVIETPLSFGAGVIASKAKQSPPLHLEIASLQEALLLMTDWAGPRSRPQIEMHLGEPIDSKIKGDPLSTSGFRHSTQARDSVEETEALDEDKEDGSRCKGNGSRKRKGGRDCHTRQRQYHLKLPIPPIPA